MSMTTYTNAKLEKEIRNQNSNPKSKSGPADKNPK
jgi:hypothetical protein